MKYFQKWNYKAKYIEELINKDYYIFFEERKYFYNKKYNKPLCGCSSISTGLLKSPFPRPAPMASHHLQAHLSFGKKKNNNKKLTGYHL